jgi:hypothetical protein
MINRAKADGQASGLIPHFVDRGVSILQYADDIIIFLKHELEKSLNMKLVLCIFGKLSGLKINFHKVGYIALGMLKMLRTTINNFLGVNLELFHSSIWGF